MKLFNLFRTAPSVDTVKESPRALELAASLSRGPYKAGTRIAAAHKRLDDRMAGMTGLHANAKVPVAQHYKAASSRNWKAALLERLVRFQGARSILEVGTAYGASGIALGLSQDRPRLVTIECSANQADIGR